MMLTGAHHTSRLVALVRTSAASRPLSTQTNVALSKLRDVFEQYRLQNYQQELPTRFKKEIIQELCKSSGKRHQYESTTGIVPNDLQRILTNIGANERLSSADMKAIFDGIGNENGEIYPSQLLQLL